MTKARSNATANAAKGDLTVGNGTNLSGVLGVGSNGDTIVADSSTSTGLRYQSNFAAGKNKIINGDFGIWQRGTSATISASTTTYLSDRFATFMDTNAGTYTYSRQTFTPGTAPVAGYEGQFFARLTTGGNCNMSFSQPVEDVRTFAGQKVTFSFWAKSSTAKTFGTSIGQNFGTSGSTFVNTAFGSFTTSTSWQRFTFTGDVPSISGKTIGTNSHLLVRLLDYQSVTGNFDVDFWGVQIEAGSVATAFQTATGTVQGETSACMRYYTRYTASSNYSAYTTGIARNTQTFDPMFYFPVPLRVAPTAVDFNLLASIPNYQGAATAISTVTINTFSPTQVQVAATSTGTPFTQNVAQFLSANNSTSSFIGFSAEL